MAMVEVGLSRARGRERSAECRESGGVARRGVAWAKLGAAARHGEQRRCLATDAPASATCALLAAVGVAGEARRCCRGNLGAQGLLHPRAVPVRVPRGPDEA